MQQQIHRDWLRNSSMNPTDPLANLRDIHLPGEVSFWPLAPGWWVLIIITLALIIWGILKWLQWRKRQLLLHEVKAELVRIESDYAKHQIVRKLVTDCSQLLRRLVVLRIGRDQGANLTGQEWRNYLQEIGITTQPDETYLELLSDGQYQRTITLDNPQQFSQWVNDIAIAMGRLIILETRNA